MKASQKPPYKTSKKILLYLPNCFYEPHFGTLLDEAEKERRAGNQVYLLLTNGLADIAASKLSNEIRECSYCAKNANKTINNISKDYIILKIINFIKVSDYSKNEYHSASDIKKIKYKGSKIGYACLSTFISRTRSLDPSFDKKSRTDFDNLLTTSKMLIDAYEKILNEIHPDTVYLFNGRFFDSRPIFDVSMRKINKVICMDTVKLGDGTFVKQIFENSTMHNIEANSAKIEKIWKSTKRKDKFAMGNKFFIYKRKGISTGDKIYIKSQENGLLPDKYDNNKRNIVIFNSSEDEFAAIDDEYEKLALFKTQIEGMDFLFRSFRNDSDFHFYLRIHPNLSGINYKYHTDLYLFQKKYSNVTVISPEEKISTYSLLVSSEKIITFGSTMGIEATYWRKPSILLSGSVYYYLNATYKPKSKQELIKLIESRNLKPKKKLNALKYGYYVMHKDSENSHKYVDFNMHNLKFLKWNFAISNYKKYWGSSVLYSICQSVLQKIYGHAYEHVIKY